MLEYFIVAIVSYLIGSIPSALWMGKITRGIDIREHGSGNVGTTNTFRVLGWKSGVVVAIIDLGKGWIASNMVAKIVPHGEYYVLVSMIAGLIAILGHMFPIYSQFRGGKGAITAGGVMLGVAPISALLAISVFLIVMFATRYVSLASVLAVISYPIILSFALDPAVSAGPYMMIAGFIVPATVIYKHKDNIRRLFNGTESRIPPFFKSKTASE